MLSLVLTLIITKFALDHIFVSTFSFGRAWLTTKDPFGCADKKGGGYIEDILVFLTCV